jgi:hypothetical protein
MCVLFERICGLLWGRFFNFFRQFGILRNDWEKFSGRDCFLRFKFEGDFDYGFSLMCGSLFEPLAN